MSGRAHTLSPTQICEIDAHHNVFAKYIGDLKVAPQQQSKLFLGHFGTRTPAKGFLIQLDPKSESTDTVVTEITMLGSPKHYELVLHVANYGYEAVTAEVWQR